MFLADYDELMLQVILSIIKECLRRKVTDAYDLFGWAHPFGYLGKKALARTRSRDQQRMKRRVHEPRCHYEVEKQLVLWFSDVAQMSVIINDLITQVFRSQKMQTDVLLLLSEFNGSAGLIFFFPLFVLLDYREDCI